MSAKKIMTLLFENASIIDSPAIVPEHSFQFILLAKIALGGAVL